MKLKIILFTFVVILFKGYTAFAQVTEDLGKIYVTATRIGQYDYNLAGNVTVIDQEQIKATNAQNIPDVLKEALGVYVYDRNSAKTATIDIRGFGDTAKSNVLVLINDRKVNSVDMSGVDLMQLPLEAVERIEIIRGAGSVLYGDNAVGGVVNIITKKGKGHLKARTGLNYGSYDKQGSDMELSGAYKDLSYFFYSKYFDDRGFRQHSDVLSKDFNTRLNYKLKDFLGVDFEYGKHDDKTDLPGGLDETELATYGRRHSTDEGNMSTTDDNFYRLSFDLSPWPEGYYFGNFVMDFTYRNRDVFDAFSGYDSTRDIKTQGITGKYTFDREIFDRQVNFVTGIDYYNTDNDIIGSNLNADDITISKEEYGLYGFLEYELLEDIFVNGGTRFNKANYIFDNRGGAAYIEKTPDDWVSMGGLKYEYAKGSSLHMNVQQTFRFLATDEWYSTWSGLNTALEQQSGIQYEAGIKHNFNDKVVLSFTPYWIDTKNEVYYDANTFANTNYDKTRRIGVEFGQEVDLKKIFEIEKLDKLELFSNYTYQMPEFNGGVYDNKEIPLVPNHQFSHGIRTKLFKFLNLSFMGNYVGSRYIINDLDNTIPQAKPYYFMDAKLGVEFKNVEAYLSLNNIFDRQYSPYQIKKTASSRDYFPAPERNFMLTVNVKF